MTEGNVFFMNQIVYVSIFDADEFDYEFDQWAKMPMVITEEVE